MSEAGSGQKGADGAIESISRESRSFPPPPEFVAKARLRDPAEYERMYRRSVDDPNGFWGDTARAELAWTKPFTTVLTGEVPWTKWFEDGELNLSANCLDRHLAKHGSKPAIVWEGEPGDERTLTFSELHAEVCKFAGALKKLGVQRGDRVAIYMPLIPEAAVAMLACTRIGAPHTVVFGGFSADALRDRINDCQAKVCVTADGGYRRGKVIPLKGNVDAALAQTPTIETCVVVKRVGNAIEMKAGRDRWWTDVMAGQAADTPAESLPAEHPLFILYTSGTTGKPKGIVHTTGGYLLGAHLTCKYIFDLQEQDQYWCTADIGWVTGHSYVVYGPLSMGATTVMYEGAPDFPDKDRFWSIIARRKVSVFYTAPTAIRAFVRWGNEFPKRNDLSSLRLLGTVGEPINPEAWMWYQDLIGGGRCPIVDTWWQTETGGIMIAPLPGATVCKPGSATRPLPGIGAAVVDEAGEPVTVGGGYAVLTRPWPGMLRGIWGDDERYRATYWEKYGDRYFAGDGARIDEDGYFWFMGRVDDVMNVSGHRISTTEVESALVDHPAVAEAAVVAKSDPDTGQAIAAFVTLRGGVEESTELIAELRDHVAKLIGAIAKPKSIAFTPDLPKTRSGKIMRRLLRDIAENRRLGDTTTLADAGVVDELQQRAREEAGKEG